MLVERGGENRWELKPLKLVPLLEGDELPQMWKAWAGGKDPALVAYNVVSNGWTSQVEESYSGRKGQAEEEKQRGDLVWKCACISDMAEEMCIKTRNFPEALI